MKAWLTALVLLLPLAAFSADEHPGRAAAPATRVSLIAQDQISPGREFSLSIDIRSADARPLDFEVLHEQRLHLVAVSSNLTCFKHLHPEYLGGGRFQLKTSLPFGGAYRLFLSYKPAGYPEQLKELSLILPGNRPRASLPDPEAATRQLGELSVRLKNQVFQAGAPSQLNFELSQAGQPVDDLEPYLGTSGHLVIIRRSPEPSVSDYQHVHPAAGPLSFATTFPEAGLYKLWLEFKRGGQVQAADFWLRVE